MPAAARRSIWSGAVREAEEFRRLPQQRATLPLLPLLQLQELLLLGAVRPVHVLLPEPEVAVAREVEAATQQARPRFAPFCRMRLPGNNLLIRYRPLPEGFRGGDSASSVKSRIQCGSELWSEM